MLTLLQPTIFCKLIKKITYNCNDTFFNLVTLCNYQLTSKKSHIIAINTLKFVTYYNYSKMLFHQLLS